MLGGVRFTTHNQDTSMAQLILLGYAKPVLGKLVNQYYARIRAMSGQPNKVYPPIQLLRLNYAIILLHISRVWISEYPRAIGARRVRA